MVIDDAFAKSLGLELLDKLQGGRQDPPAEQEHARLQRDRRSSVSCSIGSTRCTGSGCRRPWSRTSSRTSGARCGRRPPGAGSAPSRTKDTTEDKAREEYRAIAERRGAARAGAGGDRGEERHEGRRRRGASAPSSSGHASCRGASSRCGRCYLETPLRWPAIRAPIFEEKVVDFLVELAYRHGQTGDAGASSPRTRRTPRPPGRSKTEPGRLVAEPSTQIFPPMPGLRCTTGPFRSAIRLEIRG